MPATLYTRPGFETVATASVYFEDLDHDNAVNNVLTTLVHGTRMPVKMAALSRGFTEAAAVGTPDAGNATAQGMRTLEYWRWLVRTVPVTEFARGSIDNLMRASTAMSDSRQMQMRMPQMATDPNAPPQMTAAQILEASGRPDFAMVETTIALAAAHWPLAPDYSTYLRAVLRRVHAQDQNVAMTAYAGDKDWFGAGPVRLLPRTDVRQPTESELDWELTPAWALRGLGAQYQQSVVEMLQGADQPRWSLQLLPRMASTNTIEGVNPTERPNGEIARWRKLLEVVAKPFALYEITINVRDARANLLFQRWLLEQLKRRPVESEVMKFAASELEACERIAAMPLHEIYAYSVSGLGTASAIGQFGQKPSVLMHEGAYAALVTRTSEMNATVAGNLLIGDANGMMEPTGGYATDVVRSYMRWIARQLSTPNSTNVSWWELCQSDNMHSYQAVVAAYATIGILDDLGDVVRTLAWNEVRCTLGTRDYLGCDMMWTDGKQFSKPAGQMLTGRSPCIGLNNRRAYAEVIELDRDWNTAASADQHLTEIKWSIGLQEGELTAPIAALRVERNYVPQAGWLGEKDVQLVPLEQVTGIDDTLTAVRNWFMTRSPTGLINEWYTWDRAVIVPRTPNVFRTSWDPFADGTALVQSRASAESPVTTTRITAGEALVAHFSNGSPDRPSEVTATAVASIWFRQDGFNLRYPVRVKRSKELLYMMPQGIAFAHLKQRGVLLFAYNLQEITMQADTSEVDALRVALTQNWNLPDMGGRTSEKAFQLDVPKIGTAHMGIVGWGQ